MELAGRPAMMPIPEALRSRAVAFISRAMFGLAAIVLMLLALGMIVQGIVQPITIFGRAGLEDPTAFLTSIGYVVIAVAVFDVAKFLSRRRSFASARSAQPRRRGAASRASSQRSRSPSHSKRW